MSQLWLQQTANLFIHSKCRARVLGKSILADFALSEQGKATSSCLWPSSVIQLTLLCLAHHQINYDNPLIDLVSQTYGHNVYP